MGEESLKKPVHLAILKPTHIQNLAAAGKLPATQFGLDANQKPVPLPKALVEKKNALGLPKLQKQSIPKNTDLVKQTQKQVRLRVLHDRAPSPDPAPPCDTCKTAACCVAFAVNISKEEYESGLYGDAAIELTPEIYQQLSSKFLLSATLGAPASSGNEPTHFLEGKVGEPCPFLTDGNRCGIYDIRPFTCRVYSCIGDDRITESMRDGSEPIDIKTVYNNRYNKK